jgi:RNA polymerase sigma factor (sigma-70 family)
MNHQEANATIEIHINTEIDCDPLAPLNAQQLRELETLLTSQRTRLTHFVRKHLRREEQIEDLVQLTHMTAFKSWARFRGESKPETWLFGIAMNLIRNYRTKDYFAPSMVDDGEEQMMAIPADSYHEPEETLIRQEKMEALKAAIYQLPARMQAVVHLVFLEGLSYQEAAAELNLPMGTIRSRISRARDALAEIFLNN